MNAVYWLTCAFASCLFTIPIQARVKPAKCVIRQGPDLDQISYSDDCLFRAGENGTFSIRKNTGNILPSITNISVVMISPGVAEIRGLTVDGINSRWGTAKRSFDDPACWTGADFEVCAY